MKRTGSQDYRRLRLRMSVLVSLVVLLLAGWWFVTSTGQDLLTRSTVLLDPGSRPRPGYVSVIGWLTDHELLCGIGSGNGDVDDYFYAVDVRKAQYRALPTLTAFQQKNEAIPISVSPDGRWLLCSLRLHGDVFAHDHTDNWQYEIKSDRVFNLQTDPGLELVWSTDSKSCMALDKFAKSILRWPVAISGRCDRRPIESIEDNTRTIGADGQNVVFTTNATDAKQAPISEMVWSNPTYRRALCVVGSSQNRSVGTIQLSPDGRRLAWTEAKSVQRPGPPWLQRIYSKVGMGSGDYTVLWTCRLDGTDRREIGHVRADGPGDGSLGFTDFGWNFSSNGLWFTYRDSIRSVTDD